MEAKKQEMAPSLVRKQSTIQASQFLNLLLVGNAKSGGKTTFALSIPGKKLILNYDIGEVPRVPGVDPEDVTVVQYPVAQVPVREKTDNWKRPTNVGGRIIMDAEEIRNAFVEDRPLKLGGEEWPRPDVIVLDGMTELQSTALDWVLGVNNVSHPEDFENRYAAWGKRLQVIRTIVNMILPLPCHVVLTAWETQEETTKSTGGGQISSPTGRYLPDIGGKMDQILPGKVDAVLRCYAKYTGERVKYTVQCQPDGLRQYIGVRGRFDMPKEVDVTLTGKAGEVGPFERVFGKNAIPTPQLDNARESEGEEVQTQEVA